MRRYLLVDDNRPFAENLGEILSDAGDEVAIATSGAEALTLLSRGHFDVLVTDMKMPGMSGAELVCRARELDPELPAVIISAYCGQADSDRTRHEGVLAVLPKPVPITALLELLARARRAGPIGVIEDDPVLAEALTDSLTKHGFATVCARSAEEAATLVDVRPFAMVVDLMLPDSPGGEVLQWVEATFPGRPLIVMTGARDLAARLRRRHRVLEKPFSLDALLAEIDGLPQGHGPR